MIVLSLAGFYCLHKIDELIFVVSATCEYLGTRSSANQTADEGRLPRFLGINVPDSPRTWAFCSSVNVVPEREEKTAGAERSDCERSLEGKTKKFKKFT